MYHSQFVISFFNTFIFVLHPFTVYHSNNSEQRVTRVMKTWHPADAMLPVHPRRALGALFYDHIPARLPAELI